MSDRKSGIIKSYNAFKGYGFIQGDDRTEYFFHFSDTSFPIEGKQRVLFQIGFDRNNRAKAIQIERETSDANISH